MDEILTFLTGLVMNWQIFVSGCVGGFAAELMRFYQIRLLVRRPIASPLIALLVSGAHVLLGGLYASRILETPTHQAAFIAGLTLPITLAILLGEPMERKDR